MQALLVLQSMWSMEQVRVGQPERPVPEKVRLIHEAGFDGLSALWFEPEAVQVISAAIAGTGMVAEGTCFPASVDDLQQVLELAAKYPVHHINVQPNVRTNDLGEAVRIVEGWQRLIETVDFPVYIETHRDRLTNDLLFTLSLLERLPHTRLLADLSHYVVGREIGLPVSNVIQGQMAKILDHAWAFHGRVASSEQVQVEISFPQHQPWVEQFGRWWDYGFRSWRGRAGVDDALSFTCELGPKPYAISGRDGEDSTDRWAESLQMAEMARSIWAKISA